MIDTVCLLIPLHHVVFLDKANKEIPDWDLHSKTESYQKFVRNPTKTDKESGLYFPRITLYQRRYQREINVKIEFSAPKLLYENNLEELKNSDFDKVIDVLQDRLKRMGLRVFRKFLVEANVSSIHYSKNILLSEGYTANYLIAEIGKIDLRKSFDFARARYINDGQSLCAHTASHELVIYDKVSDLNKGKKRAIDRDQTPYQTSLFTELKSVNKHIEILRFEIRLGKKDKINSLFKKLGFGQNLNFTQMFNCYVSQKVVSHYWEGIINAKNNGLFTLPSSSKDFLRELYKLEPHIKPNRALYLVGLMTVSKDGNGLRELRTILAGKANDRTWYRIISDHRKLAKQTSTNKVRDWVHQVDKEIKNYQPLSRSCYEMAV
jgi:hypothetical protein